MHNSGILFVVLAAFTGIALAQFPFYIVQRTTAVVTENSDGVRIESTPGVRIESTPGVRIESTGERIESNPGERETVNRRCGGACLAIYEPVCAALAYSTRIQTFSNSCRLANARRCQSPFWVVLHQGACRSRYLTIA